MGIVQNFYNQLATQYDKLFLDWQATTQEQALMLKKLFQENGFDASAHTTRRDEMTELLLAHGCKAVTWMFPEETGFYQPIVIARK